VIQDPSVDVTAFIDTVREAFIRNTRVIVRIFPDRTVMVTRVTDTKNEGLVRGARLSLSTKVAINGAGRIGVNVLRALLQSPYNIEVVGINDPVFALNDPNPENAMAGAKNFAETIFNEFKAASRSGVQEVEIAYGKGSEGYYITDNDIVKFNLIGTPEGYWVSSNGHAISLISEKDPAILPWAALNVDVVLEATGHFTTKEDAGKHIEAGAKRVIITAPGKGGIATIVPGVNHDILAQNLDTVLSCASCTTNAIASPLKVINDAFNIVAFQMDTVHAATNDQAGAVDKLKPEAPQRGRRLEGNIIPTSTGAASAIGEVITSLKGKGGGISERVNASDGSFATITMVVEKITTKEEVNRLLREAAEGPMKGVLAYTEREIVSRDILGRSESSIVNGQYTSVQSFKGGSLVTIRTWYDNEFGYPNRLVDLIAIMTGAKASVSERPNVTKIRETPAFVQSAISEKIKTAPPDSPAGARLTEEKTALPSQNSGTGLAVEPSLSEPLAVRLRQGAPVLVSLRGANDPLVIKPSSVKGGAPVIGGKLADFLQGTALAQGLSPSATEKTITVLLEPHQLATFGMQIRKTNGREILVVNTGTGVSYLGLSPQFSSEGKITSVEVKLTVSDVSTLVSGRNQSVRMELDGLLNVNMNQGVVVAIDPVLFPDQALFDMAVLTFVAESARPDRKKVVALFRSVDPQTVETAVARLLELHRAYPRLAAKIASLFVTDVPQDYKVALVTTPENAVVLRSDILAPHKKLERGEFAVPNFDIDVVAARTVDKDKNLDERLVRAYKVLVGFDVVPGELKSVLLKSAAYALLEKYALKAIAKIGLNEYFQITRNMIRSLGQAA
jgi:glyceraldehyde 3-phosphate dehydrogenase